MAQPVHGGADEVSMESPYSGDNAADVQSMRVNGNDADNQSVGGPPLSRAIIAGDLLEVERLLDSGASPREPNANGWTPLHYAARSSNVYIIEAFLTRGHKMDGLISEHVASPLQLALQFALEGGGIENFDLILASGAELSERSGPNNMTVVEMAVVLGQFEIAIALLDRGYNVDLDRLMRFADGRSVAGEQAEYKEMILRRLGGALSEGTVRAK